jgi:MYXO-CTERM domain-containing protein
MMKQMGSAPAALGLIMWRSPGSALADVAPESTSTNPDSESGGDSTDSTDSGDDNDDEGGCAVARGPYAPAGLALLLVLGLGLGGRRRSAS